MTPQEIAAMNAGKAGRSLRDKVRAAKDNTQFGKSLFSDCPDILSLEKLRNDAIAEIKRQASIAMAAVDGEYRLAIARLASDLKKAQDGIAKADRLGKKKPTVSRTDAKAKVRCEKITPQSLATRLKDFGGDCAYCYEPLGKNKQIDHVVPISKMGADVIENIVFVCQSCNCSKGDRDPIKWYRSKSFWSKEREAKLLSVTGKLDALKV